MPHFSLLITALGGVALFIFGMEMVTSGLQTAAGHRMRSFLKRLTARQTTGFLGGTAVSAAVHSGPATLMVVGFINAGMMTLAQSIPVILGANIGTTLSMQLVAFDLGKHALAAAALGVPLRIFGKNETWRCAGSVLIGFGLLFLGLDFMKAPLPEIRDAAWMRALGEHISGHTATGMLLGISLATIVTAVFMSSGATVAIAFALADQGVLTDFDQFFPLILGAHIGTCIVTLLGCAGTSINSKRAAVAHLLFNIISSIVAIAMMPLYVRWMPAISENMVRQIANLNTFSQLVPALVFLPMAGLCAKLLEKLLPAREPEEETSHLDPSLIPTPEMALLAATQELRREVRICSRMLRQAMEALLALDLDKFEPVRKDEASVDQISGALERYFVQIAGRRLSERQAMLLQHLIASSNDIERIADHIEGIAILTRTKVARKIWFDDDSMRRLVDLSKLVMDSLAKGVESLDPTADNYRELAKELLVARKEYKRRSQQIRDGFNKRLYAGAEDAVNGMFYMRYVAIFDRIMRHVRSIARAELKPAFQIKEGRLHEHRPEMEPIRRPPASGKGLDPAELFAPPSWDLDDLEEDAAGNAAASAVPMTSTDAAPIHADDAEDGEDDADDGQRDSRDSTEVRVS